jgi:hypothetical protein
MASSLEGVAQAARLVALDANRQPPIFRAQLLPGFGDPGRDEERVDEGTVEVAREDAPTPEQERYEVLLHLRVWEAVNPDTPGELLVSLTPRHREIS